MDALCSCFSAATGDNKLMKKLTDYVANPDLINKPIDMAFRHFDKDNSGYIECNEVIAVAEKVCRAAGMSKAPTPAVNMIFDKVAGADGRLDRQEFAQLLSKMFHLAQQHTQEKMAGTAPSRPGR